MWSMAYKVLWCALLVVWAVAAIGVKRTVRRESFGSRMLYGSLFAIGFWMLVLPRGPLGIRVVPDADATQLCGVALTAAGVAFAIWARLTIGRNWSGTVTLKQDHTLIQRGPYRIVRHPIYSGILLAMLGTAIGVGHVRGLMGFAMVLLALRFKWKIEERFMVEQFGEQYMRYRHDVKAVIPGVL